MLFAGRVVSNSSLLEKALQLLNGKLYISKRRQQLQQLQQKQGKKRSELPVAS